MLLRSDVLASIRAGSVSLAFRRWRRPTVRSGGSLLTAAGRLGIASVAVTSEADITEQDAVRAGCGSREELLRELNRYPEGDLYRVEFGEITADERVELRAAIPEAAELEALLQRLARFDESSAIGPWTRTALQLISEEPGVRAEALSARAGLDKPVFKANVRKLKALGLTISLETGYRLSPRGEVVLEALRANP